jgi:hypothetical protein
MLQKDKKAFSSVSSVFIICRIAAFIYSMLLPFEAKLLDLSRITGNIIKSKIALKYTVAEVAEQTCHLTDSPHKAVRALYLCADNEKAVCFPVPTRFGDENGFK